MSLECKWPQSPPPHAVLEPGAWQSPGLRAGGDGYSPLVLSHKEHQCSALRTGFETDAPASSEMVWLCWYYTDIYQCRPKIPSSLRLCLKSRKTNDNFTKDMQSLLPNLSFRAVKKMGDGGDNSCYTGFSQVRLYAFLPGTSSTLQRQTRQDLKFCCCCSFKICLNTEDTMPLHFCIPELCYL